MTTHQDLLLAELLPAFDKPSSTTAKQNNVVDSASRRIRDNCPSTTRNEYERIRFESFDAFEDQLRIIINEMERELT